MCLCLTPNSSRAREAHLPCSFLPATLNKEHERDAKLVEPLSLCRLTRWTAASSSRGSAVTYWRRLARESAFSPTATHEERFTLAALRLNHLSTRIILFSLHLGASCSVASREDLLPLLTDICFLNKQRVACLAGKCASRALTYSPSSLVDSFRVSRTHPSRSLPDIAYRVTSARVRSALCLTLHQLFAGSMRTRTSPRASQSFPRTD